MFQERYKSLYNCVSCDPQQMAALLEETKLDIGNVVGRCSVSFIIDDIKSSILSDHIINGTRKLRDHITVLFTIMISHGFRFQKISANQ